MDTQTATQTPLTSDILGRTVRWYGEQCTVVDFFPERNSICLYGKGRRYIGWVDAADCIARSAR